MNLPDSTEILPADSDRDLWLTTRREGIGGSDASTVAGVNPFETLYRLWLDKTGRGIETPYTAEMRFGHLIEDDARQVFTEDTGIGITLAGLHRSNTRPWQQCTVDGITSDGGLAEIKSVGWRQAEKWANDQIADHAEVQVQHNMAVTGLPHAWVIWELERHFYWRRIERNETFIELLTEMELEFWERHVLGDEEPPLVAEDHDTVKALYPRVEPGVVRLSETDWLRDQLTAHAAAVAAVKAAESEKKRLEAELIDYIGEAESAGWWDDDGDQVVAVTRKEHIRSSYTVPAGTYRQLRVLDRPKKGN